MKVVGFVGSPRKGGNTDTLVEQILAGAADADHETEKVYLTDYALTPIDPVYGEETNWTDPRQDVADQLIDKMVAAEVVVLGTPVYWFSASGLLKLFIDRWSLYQRDDKRLGDLMAGKKLVVAVAMADANAEYVEDVLAPLRRAAEWLKMQWAGEVVATGVSAPGEVKQRPDLLASARALGQSL